jgi:hypothetical protein
MIAIHDVDVIMIVKTVMEIVEIVDTFTGMKTKVHPVSRVSSLI